MVIPLLLNGPSGRGQSIQGFIAEQQRQVNIIRQSTCGNSTVPIDVFGSNPEQSQGAPQTLSSRIASNDSPHKEDKPRSGKSLRKLFSRNDLRSEPLVTVAYTGEDGTLTSFDGHSVRREYIPEDLPFAECPASDGTLGSDISLHQRLTVDKSEPNGFPAPAYPITQSFFAIAKTLVTPMGKQFQIDPLKLGWQNIFMSSVGCVDVPYRVLDLGGSEIDIFVSQLAAGRNCCVYKALLGDLNRTIVDGKISECKFDTTHDLALLPYSDGYFNVITARSLYKGTTNTPTSGQQAQELKLKDCLAECNRVLLPGGRLEYIYFQNELLSRGPLMLELEQFLWEVHCDASATSGAHPSSHLPQGTPIARFHDLLHETGFVQEKTLIMNFPVFMLSQLFNHRGCRKTEAVVNDTHGSRAHKLHPQSPDYLRGNVQTQRLLRKIHEECETWVTGWVCSIGWATKSRDPKGTQRPE